MNGSHSCPLSFQNLPSLFYSTRGLTWAGGHPHSPHSLLWVRMSHLRSGLAASGRVRTTSGDSPLASGPRCPLEGTEDVGWAPGPQQACREGLPPAGPPSGLNVAKGPALGGLPGPSSDVHTLEPAGSNGSSGSPLRTCGSLQMLGGPRNIGAQSQPNGGLLSKRALRPRCLGWQRPGAGGGTAQRGPSPPPLPVQDAGEGLREKPRGSCVSLGPVSRAG